MTSSDTLRERRAAAIRAHMDSENRQAFDETLATFAHPRYEIVPTGEVHDGPEEVMRYFKSSRTTFPDQRNELHAMHHADDAVIVEFDLLGTHRGALGPFPPTGKSFRVRMAAVFLFAPGGDGIVCERVYFDALSLLRQLEILPGAGS